MYLDPSQKPGVAPRPYDISLIETPMALFIGGYDGLLDIPSLLQHTPLDTYVYFEPTYEHMDYIWAEDAVLPGKTFENVLAFLKKHEDTSSIHADEKAMNRRFGHAHPQQLISRVLQEEEEPTQPSGLTDNEHDLLAQESQLGGYLEFRPVHIRQEEEDRYTDTDRGRSLRRWKWLLLTLRRTHTQNATPDASAGHNVLIDTQLIRSVYRRMQNIPEFSSLRGEAEAILENRITNGESADDSEESQSSSPNQHI